jgi:hypothetical protein
MEEIKCYICKDVIATFSTAGYWFLRPENTLCFACVHRDKELEI